MTSYSGTACKKWVIEANGIAAAYTVYLTVRHHPRHEPKPARLPRPHPLRTRPGLRLRQLRLHHPAPLGRPPGPREPLGRPLSHALTGLSVALAQDPDSVREFLDFSHAGGLQLRFLVFDGRFTAYACLQRLDQAGIRFVTVRRRGRNLVRAARDAPPDQRRTIRVPEHQGTRLLEVVESTAPLRHCGGEIRQIAVLHRASRPALLITNDFDSSLASLLRRYTRRWLVEKSISVQLSFFHLNRISSSMVIQVDFDLAMTVLAYNLYRLLALELPPVYRQSTPQTLLETAADIRLDPYRCTVSLKKKRNLPALPVALGSETSEPLPRPGSRRLAFNGASSA